MKMIKTFNDLRPGDKVYIGNYNWNLPNVIVSKYELIVESTSIENGRNNTDCVKLIFNKNISDNVPRKDLYVFPYASSWGTIKNKNNITTSVCINESCLL